MADPFWRLRYNWLRLFCVLVPKADRRALLPLTEYGILGMFVFFWARPTRWALDRFAR